MKGHVLDLWCGTKSATKIWEHEGYNVISIDLDEQFEPTICADIMDITPEMLLEFSDGQPFLFGWASPQCTIYSLMNMRWNRHWGDGQPLTQEAKDQNERVKHTIHLLKSTCKYWIIENPRAMLRTQPFMKILERESVSYCRYGDDRMKPTDLWGVFPGSWVPRPMCSYGHPDHAPAPRGSRNGTQGMDTITAGMIPFALTQELYDAVMISEKTGIGQRSNLTKWMDDEE
tara:strand:- start:1445 stop:2134 length:690 start_codon:yes stop_codon:yes gene_type:complete